MSDTEKIDKKLSSAGLPTTEDRAIAKSKRYIMSGGEHPIPLLIFENICRLIENDDALSTRFRLNDFSHMIETLQDGRWENLNDMTIYETQRYISSTYRAFSKVSTEMTTAAIRTVAHQHKINPPRDYMINLIWDTKPRIDTWLAQAFGTPETDLYKAMGSNWLKGLVNRVMNPGCHFDEILVLESPQGWRKSTALRELAKPWHVECTTSLNDKDFYMNLAQNVVVEFAEGDVINKTDARKIKAIVTKVEDQWRPPYERGLLKIPRGCVFAMTTNDRDYQKDDTGGRRWLPVELTKVADIDWIRENRDQLYAEAYHRVITLKETTYEYPREEMEALQEQRMEHNDYEESIVEWYVKIPDNLKQEGIKIIDAYLGVISKTSDREMNRAMEMQISGMFKRMLFLEKRQNRRNGLKTMRWYPTKKTPVSTPEDNF